MARTLDLQPVGCWILKANPAISDYLGMLATSGAIAGKRRSMSWTVRDSYRADRMVVGDLVALWVTGTDPTGIHEIGRLVGPAGPPGDDRQRTVVYDAVLLREPVPRHELAADPALSGCEQLTIPLIGNPSFLTIPQTAALSARLAGRITKRAARSVGWQPRW